MIEDWLLDTLREVRLSLSHLAESKGQDNCHFVCGPTRQCSCLSVCRNDDTQANRQAYRGADCSLTIFLISCPSLKQQICPMTWATCVLVNYAIYYVSKC